LGIRADKSGALPLGSFFLLYQSGFMVSMSPLVGVPSFLMKCKIMS
jgi:hypothetical protein